MSRGKKKKPQPQHQDERPSQPPRPPAPSAPSTESTPLLRGGGGGGDGDLPVVTTAAAATRGSKAEEARHHYEEERRYCRRTLVFRHLLTCLFQRIWDFAIVLLLTVVGPKDSFVLIASYGITVSVTVAFLSPSVGDLVDGANRLSAVVAVTAMQNACTVVCGACFLVLLYLGLKPASWAWHVLVVLVHIFGALNNTFYGLANIVIERDWVVVIAQSDDAWLRSMTSNLKAIDLLCDLVAPMFVSLLLEVISYGAIAGAISACNVVMIYLQYTALHEIYHRVPDLQKEEPLSVFSAAAEEAWTGATTSAAALAAMEASVEPPPRPQTGNASLAKQACLALWDFGHHCRIYVRQRSFLPGLTLAMLYLTVLSFHTVMLAYLLMRGLKPVYIALGQGFASVMGVLGTLVYDFLAARIGMTNTGMVALWSQVACLTLAVAALYYPGLAGADGQGFSLGLFITAVVLSRFGLYMYDVAGAQIFQVQVEEEHRAVVGGVQRTLESLFELAHFLLVLCLPHPDQFPLLATLSYLETVGAALVFSVYAVGQAMEVKRTRTLGSEGHGSEARVRAISPIINKFHRLSTITSEGSAASNGTQEEDEGNHGNGGSISSNGGSKAKAKA